MRTTVLTASLALQLLALIGMVSPAIAGPPEAVSGRMEFDEVADGLRKYANEKDREKRTQWLKKLAPTKDPRVAVALIDALPSGSTTLVEEDLILAEYFIKGTRFHTGSGYFADEWLRANEADLRRRAAQLPR
jgi:hypothetical protein